MTDVVKRIEELMKDKKWTPYELSNQTGISANAVYDWIKSGAMPTVQNIIRICDSMGITLERFFCGDDGAYSDKEIEVLNKWKKLSESERAVVLDLMRAFNGR